MHRRCTHLALAACALLIGGALSYRPGDESAAAEDCDAAGLFQHSLSHLRPTAELAAPFVANGTAGADGATVSRLQEVEILFGREPWQRRTEEAVALLLLVTTLLWETATFCWPSRKLPADRNARFQRYALRVAKLAIVCTVCIGVLVEHWSLVNTAYYMAQILTTVGYGDMAPKTQWFRLWTILIILVSLVLLTQMSKAWTDRLDSSEQTLERIFERSQVTMGEESSPKELEVARKLDSKDHTRSQMLASGVVFLGFIAAGTLFYGTVESCSCSYGLTQIAGCVDSNCVATGGEVKTWIDACYFSVVTLTTVGFGDLSMRTWSGRVFGIPWMILGVAAAANFVAAMWAWLSHVQRTERSSAVGKGVIEQLAADGHGGLTKAEHHLYVLFKHGLVHHDLLDKLDSQFQALDKDNSGRLSFEVVQTAYQ